MRKIFLLLFCVSLLEVKAQQVPDLYHYYMYPALYNPAAIGLHSYTEVLTLYKNQWSGIPDGPQTQLLMINTPLKNNKIGLGLTLYNDQLNIIGNTGAYSSLAYRLRVADNHSLSFGFSLGASNQRIYFDKIRAEDPYESSLFSNSENIIKADGSAGLMYQWNKLDVSFSSQHLIQNSYHFQNLKDRKTLYYKLVRHYNLALSYKVIINPNLETVPMLFIRSAQGLPSQIEINNTLRYKNKFWINLAYRHQASAGVSLGMLLDDKFTVGYHFEYPLTSVNIATSGAYEIALSYRFGGKKDNVHIEGIEKLYKDNEEQYEMIDQLEKKTDTIQHRLDQHDKEILELRKIFKNEQDQTNNLKEEEEVAVSDLDKNKVHTHLDHYLVIGSFGNVQNAKLFQQVMKREYGLESRIALSRPIGGKSHFLVYTNIVQQSDEAKKDIKKLKDMDKKNLINKTPWLYRVK